jgi:ribose/xylose/arabinose/galactoside ABC-type transport system permease subunit
VSASVSSPPLGADSPERAGLLSRLWERNQSIIPSLAAVALLIVMLVYAEIAYGRVFHAGTMSSLLVSFAPTIILAVGMTIVILSGGIDLSVGAVVAFTSVAGVMLMNVGVNGWLSILLMIVFGALFGLVSGVMIQYFNVQPFIATLAMMFLARGLASILSTVPVQAPEDSPIHLFATDFKLFDGPKVNDLVLTPGFFIAVIVVIAAFIFLHRTRMGRTVYGIGGAESSAQLMGLPVARTRVWIYVISGALAGLAAVVYTAEVGGKAQNVTAIGWELDAIAAVVIGGTLLTGGAGYVLGSVVGSLVLATLWMIITKDGTIRPEYLTIITGGILLVFVLLQRVLTARRRK